ncbi:DUF938 domain-containing protein [Woodsholea maritima]|uniref:DUF938 domain-containing protein n=1 Tax=Woodsholea maritima TaxID=240237 RepID=UPI00037F313A|nr:DUF938 domain-containing protein [Woodsholea maritima]
MTDPLSTPIALEERAYEGARLTSPSAERNQGVISEVLAEHLPLQARVLEIASGTGQHALAITRARPDLTWQPSDPDQASRASIDAWAALGEGRIAPALAIDTCVSNWFEAYIDQISSLYCANMIHIAPWAAAEGLFEGAGAILSRSAGVFMLYGPFLEGEASAPSNLDFDVSLKSRDPRWGVRALSDVVALGAEHGLSLSARIAMPANNLMLKFERVEG